MKRFVIIVLALLLLTGCSADKLPPDASPAEQLAFSEWHQYPPTDEQWQKANNALKLLESHYREPGDDFLTQAEIARTLISMGTEEESGYDLAVSMMAISTGKRTQSFADALGQI